MARQITVKLVSKFFTVTILIAFTTAVVLSVLAYVNQPLWKCREKPVQNSQHYPHESDSIIVTTYGTSLGKTLGKPAIVNSIRRYHPEQDVDGRSKQVMIKHNKGTIVKMPRLRMNEYVQQNEVMQKKWREAINCLFNQTGKRDTDTCLVKMLKNPIYVCPDSIRIGHPIEDGGWVACLTEPFGFTPPCIVFSFGIGNDWKFDDDMAVYYNCTVYAFDPSISTKRHDRRENLHFYDIGIGASDTKPTGGGWRMMTFKSILQMLNLTNATIDMVKIDIESGEYQVIPAMLEDGSMKNVKQLSFEIHFRGPYLRLFAVLANNKFVNYGYLMNLHCPAVFGGVRCSCYEVFYYNKLFL